MAAPTSRTRPPSLEALPPELALIVFEQLSYFPDVFALAATCSGLRNIWLNNVFVIYAKIAPRTIRCIPHARALIADQGFAPVPSSSLSHADVLQIVRNDRVARRSAHLFGRDVVGNQGATGHGPYHLTSSEQRRFIRTYYRVWGLMELDASSRRERLSRCSLRQLYMAGEMATLPLPLGREIPPPDFDSKDWKSFVLSESRKVLYSEIHHWRRTVRLRIHASQRAPDWYGTEGRALYALFLDAFQDDLKLVTLGFRRVAELTPDYVREAWGESSEEEAYKPVVYL